MFRCDVMDGRAGRIVLVVWRLDEVFVALDDVAMPYDSEPDLADHARVGGGFKIDGHEINVFKFVFHATMFLWFVRFFFVRFFRINRIRVASLVEALYLIDLLPHVYGQEDKACEDNQCHCRIVILLP